MKSIAIIMAALLCAACEFSKDLNVENIEGYELKREGDKHLAINCATKSLKPFMRGCEGQMTEGLSDPKLYCSGGLWALNEICYIQMLDTHKGNVKCKKQ